MEQKWLILVLSVTVHLGLLLAFAPSYWAPVKRLGRRFSTLVVPFVVPIAFAAMLFMSLLDNWPALPAWAKVVGVLGMGAATATLTLNVKMLRAIESRQE